MTALQAILSAIYRGIDSEETELLELELVGERDELIDAVGECALCLSKAREFLAVAVAEAYVFEGVNGGTLSDSCQPPMNERGQSK